MIIENKIHQWISEYRKFFLQPKYDKDMTSCMLTEGGIDPTFRHAKVWAVFYIVISVTGQKGADLRTPGTCGSSAGHLLLIWPLSTFCTSSRREKHYTFTHFGSLVSTFPRESFHFQYLVSRCKVLFYNIRRQGYNCDEQKTTFVVTFTHYERVKLFEMYLNVSSAFPFSIPHVTWPGADWIL